MWAAVVDSACPFHVFFYSSDDWPGVRIGGSVLIRRVLAGVGIGELLLMIGGRVLVHRVLSWFWGGIGGLLLIIGGRVLIRRVLAWVWGGIGGLLLMIGGRVLIWRGLGWDRRVAADHRR